MMLEVTLDVNRSKNGNNQAKKGEMQASMKVRTMNVKNNLKSLLIEFKLNINGSYKKIDDPGILTLLPLKVIQLCRHRNLKKANL